MMGRSVMTSLQTAAGDREKLSKLWNFRNCFFSTKLISISSSLFFQILEEKCEVNQDHQTRSQLICLCDNVC